MLNRRAKLLLAALALAAGLSRAALAQRPLPRESARPVALAELDGSVNPGSADYLIRAIHLAEQQGFAALVIRVDTPGGMLESTREIVKAELASSVPVVVWIGPSGARAGSAGVFITMAANVAAMAPATNIGAAHPVSVGAGGQEQQDETMAEKVTNDAAAWARGIAAQRGRNAEWAAEAVRKSVSIHAEEALQQRVVDLVAPDVKALLANIDGRSVQTAAGEVKLEVAHSEIRPLEPTPRERLLDALGDPNFAFLLLGLGALGILAELYHPGTVFPGVLGVASVALGLVATRMLPVNGGALVLLLVGAALIGAEFFVTSWGLFAVAGVACFSIGAFLLINPADPGYMVDRGFGVDWLMVGPIVLSVAALLALVAWKVGASRRAPQTTGAAGLVGEEGRAVSEVSAAGGKVFLHGEFWQARSSAVIPEGARVRVARVEGLVVDVAPAEGADEGSAGAAR